MPEESEIWWRLRISLREWAQDAVISFLSENGCNGLELLEGRSGKVLLAYARDEETFLGLCPRLKDYGKALEEIHGSNPLLGVELEQLQDPGWANAWKAYFKPSMVSRRLAVRPPWSPFQGPEGVKVIQIEPGQAFGTGLHETTRLCLSWMDDLLTEGCSLETALDLGTGTGILALAMARLGVKRVVALDLDPLAVEAAQWNIRINGLEGKIQVLEGGLDLVGARRFPLVVANLTGSTLIGISRELVRVVCPGGTLLVSGILGEETKSVAECFQRVGMKKLASRSMGEWCAMLLCSAA
jgi:ribosomal protein L11 methyltransferase